MQPPPCVFYFYKSSRRIFELACRQPLQGRRQAICFIERSHRELTSHELICAAYWEKPFCSRIMQPKSLSPRSLVHQVHELLANYCTGSSGRNIFLNKVNSILEASTLNSDQDIDTLWRYSWDKPLYADQVAQIATNLIDGLRAMSPPPFDDFENLPADALLLEGLKRRGQKHARVVALGAQWRSIYELHVVTAKMVEDRLEVENVKDVIEFAREVLGVPGFIHHRSNASLFEAIDDIEGFGRITTLHLSIDLGYPVYKPDRWLVRFAAVDPSVRHAIEVKLPKGKTLDDLSQSYLERHVDLVLFAVDHLTAQFGLDPQPKEITDLSVAFRRHRFVDLMVSKFGMTPESQFGIEISGKDLLLMDSKLADRYPDLFRIAVEMEHVAAKRREAGRRKRQEKARAKRLAAQTHC